MGLEECLLQEIVELGVGACELAHLAHHQGEHLVVFKNRGYRQGERGAEAEGPSGLFQRMQLASVCLCPERHGVSKRNARLGKFGVGVGAHAHRAAMCMDCFRQFRYVDWKTMRLWPRTLTRACLLFWVGASVPARAADSSASVFEVACAELAPEALAEVEARSRVEAQLTALGPLSVQLRCSDKELTVRVTSREPEVRVHVVTRARDGAQVTNALVDLLVHALHTFPPGGLRETSDDAASGVASVALSPGESARSSEAVGPVEGVGPGESARSSEAVGASESATRGATAGPGGASVVPTSEVESQVGPAAPLPKESPTPAMRPRSSEEERRPSVARSGPPPRASRRFNLDALGIYESLGSGAVGTLGFGANGFLALTERLRVGPTGRVGWAARAQSLELVAVSVGLEGEFRFTRYLWAALRPELSLHNYHATRPAQAHGSDLLAGLSIGAGVLWGGDVALRSGVALALYTHERIVRVDGVEIFRAPMAAVALHLGGRFEFGPVLRRSPQKP
jgi:hypothetical protein